MSTRMKLIMENWRQFSSLDVLLAENKKASELDIKKLATIQAKNIDNEQVQQKITSALMSDPEVKKMAAILTQALASAGKQVSDDSPAENELEDLGLEEGFGNLWTRLNAAVGSARGGDMEGALQMVGLGKIADANPKVLGAAILLVGGAATAGGAIDPVDAAKLATIGAKVSIGGVNAITPDDIQDIASATSGVDGGKQAEQ